MGISAHPNFLPFLGGREALRVEGYSSCFDFPEYEYGEKY
jgi:hypothetical protein